MQKGILLITHVDESSFNKKVSYNTLQIDMGLASPCNEPHFNGLLPPPNGKCSRERAELRITQGEMIPGVFKRMSWRLARTGVGSKVKPNASQLSWMMGVTSPFW